MSNADILPSRGGVAKDGSCVRATSTCTSIVVLLLALTGICSTHGSLLISLLSCSSAITCTSTALLTGRAADIWPKPTSAILLSSFPIRATLPMNPASALSLSRGPVSKVDLITGAASRGRSTAVVPAGITDLKGKKSCGACTCCMRLGSPLHCAFCWGICQDLS